MDDKAKLEAKKAEIQSRFDQLETLRKQEAEKRSVIDRNLSEIVTEQTRLQGENRVIEDLLGISPQGQAPTQEAKGPKPKIPSKKKEN